MKEGDIVQTFGTIYTGKYAFQGSPGEFQEEQTADEIENSVDAYGGFYIAKYEAGIEGIKDNFTLYNEAERDSSALTSTDTKPLSQQGKGVWNWISREDAISVSKIMVNTSIGSKSALISGACWDTTLQWIKNTVDPTYDENSEGKGNYDEDANTNEWRGKITTTGKIIDYSKNNIYDMAGNAYDRTSEIAPNNWIAVRGGTYVSSGASNPAAYRGPNNDLTPFLGFRVVLYKEASDS